MRHWTEEGRIVYDRPHHSWSAADLTRVASGFSKAAEGADDITVKLLRDVIQGVNLALLRAVLARFGLGDLTEAIYYTSTSLVDYLLLEAYNAGNYDLQQFCLDWLARFDRLRQDYNLPTGL